MPAYSTEGTGPGSALKTGSMGGDGSWLGVDKLIGTRVVLTGSVTLSGGTATVTFPSTLPGADADYFVFAGGSAAYAYASSVTTSGFTMTGTGTQTVNYMVVLKTNATVLPADFNE